MPISFDEIASIGDQLSSDRFTLYLSGVEGDRILTLQQATVSIPAHEVSQILVKIFGWPVAFAGRRVQENSFNVNFYENVFAQTSTALLNWQKLAAEFEKAGGAPRNEYAKKAKLEVYDTTGKSALTFNLNNCWPMRITHPEGSEDTAAYQVSVDFSVDSVDFVGLTSEGVQYSSTNAPSGIDNLPISLPSYGMSPGASLGVIGQFFGANSSITGRLADAAGSTNVFGQWLSSLKG